MFIWAAEHLPWSVSLILVAVSQAGVETKKVDIASSLYSLCLLLWQRYAACALLGILWPWEERRFAYVYVCSGSFHAALVRIYGDNYESIQLRGLPLHVWDSNRLLPFKRYTSGGVTLFLDVIYELSVTGRMGTSGELALLYSQTGELRSVISIDSENTL